LHGQSLAAQASRALGLGHDNVSWSAVTDCLGQIDLLSDGSSKNLPVGIETLD